MNRNASRNTQQEKPWDWWVTTAENHIKFHSCQPKMGIWGYSRYWLAKIKQLRSGKRPGEVLQIFHWILTSSSAWFLFIIDDEFEFRAYFSSEISVLVPLAAPQTPLHLCGHVCVYSSRQTICDKALNSMAWRWKMSVHINPAGNPPSNTLTFSQFAGLAASAFPQ